LSSSLRSALRFAVSQLAVALITFAALRLGANAATAGFAFLLSILGIAVWTNLATALTSSLLATLLYNYFFFPPVRTLTIHEPANWVALISFFIASVVATRLVLRARQRTSDAEARQREVEALYKLSVQLFTGALRDAAARALAYAGANGGGLILFTDGEQQIISWEGSKDYEVEALIGKAAQENRSIDVRRAGGRDVYVPITIGGGVAGVLAIHGTNTTLPALESAATLVGLAFERERFLAETAHVQALREGDALKTSLLRAVSHDLATPLTAVALQVERLQSLVAGDAATLVSDIREHTGRLRRRIENLLAMARVEARSVAPRPVPTPAADLFRSAREHLPAVAQTRRIDVRVSSECPDVYVDPSLALEILANLIEYEHQASPVGSSIELTADDHPADTARVLVEVADRGPGLQKDGEASDTPRRGLGLEIARSLASASGGQVTLTNRAGGGAVAYIDLPATYLPLVEEVPA
jgi:two-component system sensor histidine kinase KdpD